ncbi:MAG: sensor histidine kinase [Ideonella sp.]|nr:sensor histidine kinase [Ideonella sp.]
MNVRAKLGLTIFATGLATALLVIASVVVAFERFERESAYQRARGFLVRVAAQYDNLLELQQRHPADFNAWLANLVLFEPDSQLLPARRRGRVLATSARIALTPELRVAMAPVRESAGGARSAYVMGDDPERMDADAVVAAQALRRAQIHATDPAAGYLYLVCHPGGEAAANRWTAVRSSYGVPALVSIAAIVALMTALAAWLAASITRPLALLTGAAAAVSREGLESGAGQAALPPAGSDEFGQLARVFRQMLAKLHEQWTALSRLDQFRREAVSNLSHDLRSPLTATVACLETLQAHGARAAAADAELIEVALRNTRNAARLRVTVADTGPGIAAAELPQLFDRFFQGRQPQEQGTAGPAPVGGGLGLGPGHRQAHRRAARRRCRGEQRAGPGHDSHARVPGAAAARVGKALVPPRAVGTTFAPLAAGARQRQVATGTARRRGIEETTVARDAGAFTGAPCRCSDKPTRADDERQRRQTDSSGASCSSGSRANAGPPRLLTPRSGRAQPRGLTTRWTARAAVAADRWVTRSRSCPPAVHSGAPRPGLPQ